MPTASIVKGRGYLNHNDRTIKQVNSRSWKAELSSQNIVYVNEPIQNVYHELFDPALENYNQSQIKKNHPERQIKDYYEHISRSKQEKPLDSNVGHWVVFIGIVIVTIGFLIAVIGSLGWFVHKIYTEYTNNWLSVAIALISLSGAVFFADELHKVDCNWFFIVLGIQIFYLFGGLMNASNQNQ